MNVKNIKTDSDGYLVDGATGDWVIFYTCDPSKNGECDKALCRAGTEEGIGFCSSSPDPAHRAAGTRPFYKRLNGAGYFGREYVGEVDA